MFFISDLSPEPSPTWNKIKFLSSPDVSMTRDDRLILCEVVVVYIFSISDLQSEFLPTWSKIKLCSDGVVVMVWAFCVRVITANSPTWKKIKFSSSPAVSRTWDDGWNCTDDTLPWIKLKKRKKNIRLGAMLLIASFHLNVCCDVRPITHLYLCLYKGIKLCAWSSV